MAIEHVYLSRHNLLTLLSKLDRVQDGEESQCTIIKCDPTHQTYPQSMPQIAVTAVEDDVYYCDRQPGRIHPRDTPESHI